MKKRQNNPDTEKEENLLEGIPGLSGKEESFRVPEGYFDTLPGRISDAIHRSDQTGTKSSQTLLPTIQRNVWMPLLAAASLVIAFILFSPFEGEKDAGNGMASDTLSRAATYDASYASDLLTDDISASERMLETMPDDAEISFEYAYPAGDTLVEEAILEYLKNQELDTDLLAQLEQ